MQLPTGRRDDHMELTMEAWTLDRADLPLKAQLQRRPRTWGQPNRQGQGNF